MPNKVRDWSEAQLSLLDLAQYDERFILALGDVGTGKTAAGLAGFLKWACYAMPRGCAFGLVALTQLLVRQKLLPELRRFVREHKGRMPSIRNNEFVLNHQRFIILSGHNARSADAIQGLTLQGAFVDEVTTIPHQVLDELNNRLRAPGLTGQKLVMTANPAAPEHKHGFMFMQRWYSRAAEIGMRVLYLVRGDNPVIGDDFYDSQELTGTVGSRARRLGGGRFWQSDYGGVFQSYVVDSAPPRELAHDWWVAIDPGTATTTGALVFGHYGDTWWISDEYYYEAVQRGAVPVSQHAHQIAAWLDGLGVIPSRIIYDAASRDMGLEIARRMPMSRVVKCRKGPDSREEAYQKARLWLEHGKLKIDGRCKNLLAEIGMKHFEPLSIEKAEPRIAKGNDHLIDCMKDFVYTNRDRKLPKVVA